MTRSVPHAAVIRSEASAWLAQLETGNLDDADVDAIREWMARSPRHTMELKRLARLSSELNVLTEMAGPITQAAEAYQPVVRGTIGSGFAVPAIALTILMAMASVYWYSSNPPVDQAASLVVTRTLTTAVGEYGEHTISDGSRISLNTRSELAVNFDEYERRVTLYGGEALFTVARDLNRPFVVVAGNSEVKALGTAFVVRYIHEEVEVSVTEGTVMLSTVSPSGHPSDEHARGTPRATPIVLEKGQSLKVGMDDPSKPVNVQTVSDTDLRRKLAWREGLLDFHRTPLRQVVAEVSRHSGITIIIQDETLQNLEYEGLFRVGDSEKLLQALDLRDGIEVRYLDADTVLLSLRDVASD